MSQQQQQPIFLSFSSIENINGFSKWFFSGFFNVFFNLLNRHPDLNLLSVHKVYITHDQLGNSFHVLMPAYRGARGGNERTRKRG